MAVSIFPVPLSGIQETLVDAKGDLVVGTAADTVGRLAVGTDGFFLKADSTAGTGLVWSTVPASGADEQLIVMKAL